MKFIVSTVCSTLVCLSALGAKKSTSSDNLLKETTAKYRSSAQIELTVEKTLKTALNPDGKKHKGKIFLSSGLFRIENLEPEKSTLVFDGTYIWTEQPPSQDFPGPIQVSKTRIDGKNRAQILFATLLTKDPIAKQFSILSSSNEGDLTVFQAEPLKKDSNIKRLVLKISTTKKEVTQISYSDEIENITEMEFTHTKFISKKNPKLFQYKPPKGIQATEI